MKRKYHCVLCGYISTASFCPNCIDKARDNFDRICAYIKEHPNPTVVEVYGATAIPFAVISGLVDMGWVELVGNREIKVTKS